MNSPGGYGQLAGQVWLPGPSCQDNAPVKALKTASTSAPKVMIPSGTPKALRSTSTPGLSATLPIQFPATLLKTRNTSVPNRTRSFPSVSPSKYVHNVVTVDQLREYFAMVAVGDDPDKKPATVRKQWERGLENALACGAALKWERYVWLV